MSRLMMGLSILETSPQGQNRTGVCMSDLVGTNIFDPQEQVAYRPVSRGVSEIDIRNSP